MQECSKVGQREGKPMTRVIIIRHGCSAANKTRVYSGQTDVALEPEGIEQAKLACRYVKDHFSVDRVYSSDLSRAVLTVSPLAEALALPIEKRPDLREVDVGLWAGITFDEIATKFPESRKIMLATPHLGGFDGGETYAEFYQRATAAFTAVAEENPGKTVAIGTHGGAIRMFLCMVLGVPLSNMSEVPIVPNCSVTVAEYEAGKWSLPIIGYRGHLEEPMAESQVL